jgi:hypothetical protein
MKRVIAFALGGAALLAGCSQNGYKPPAAKLLRPAEAAPSTVLTAPTPVSGMSWFVAEDGDQAKLAYGKSATEEVKLVLACRKGSGKLNVTRYVTTDNKAGDPPVLTLAAGSARGRWLAESKPAADGAGAGALSVDVLTTEPAIDAFVRHGWVDAILADGKVEGMAPQPGDTAVHRFFDYCG